MGRDHGDQPQARVSPRQGGAARHDEGAARPHHPDRLASSARSGNPGQANYAAAKAALIGFTKSLAQEVGSRNITVNCVAPGFIDTDMTKALPDAQREALLARIPLGRLGAPEDIAHAVAFLAGPRGGLHHRRDAARQRRHVHGVKAPAGIRIRRTAMVRHSGKIARF